MNKKNGRPENDDQVVPETSSNKESDPDEKKTTPRGVVYLSRLPLRFLESDIIRYFKIYGEVTDAKVMRSKITGMSKRRAYVEFKDVEIAEIVAHLVNNAVLDVNEQSESSHIIERSVIKAIYVSPEKQASFKEHFYNIDGTGLNLRLEKEFVRSFSHPLYFKTSNLEATGDEEEKGNCEVLPSTLEQERDVNNSASIDKILQIENQESSDDEVNGSESLPNEAENDDAAGVTEENNDEAGGGNEPNDNVQPSTSRGSQTDAASADGVTNQNQNNPSNANPRNPKKRMIFSNELVLALVKALHSTPPTNSSDDSSDESDDSDSDDSDSSDSDDSDSSDSDDSDSSDSDDSDGSSDDDDGDGGSDGYDTDDDYVGRKRLRDVEQESEDEEEPAPKQVRKNKRNPA